MYLADIFMFLLILPATAYSVPCKTTVTALPFGLQIMTKQAERITFLQISQMLMQQNELQQP